MTPCRVLVVDDDLAIRMLVQRILMVQGFEVQLAQTGAEALDRLAAVPFDGIVLDYHLPGVHGEALCRAIKERCATPILLISGNQFVNLSALVQAHLAEAYLMKPFSMQAFLQSVDQILAAETASKQRQAATHPASSN